MNGANGLREGHEGRAYQWGVAKTEDDSGDGNEQRGIPSVLA